MINSNWLLPVELERQEVLSILQNSSFNFYLTGSRFFGTASLHSDIDFFTEDCKDVETFLIDLGFTVERFSLYNGNLTDINTAKIYRNKDIAVDVQLVKHVEIKKEVQDHMLDTNTLPPISPLLSKSVMRAWWDNYYKTYLFNKRMERKIAE